ncbi:hypothetical protein [uncultured Algibacter sp.]|uniref:hypothetical protein n=1 Tax=uncultured Algibacter sp. TaxID=298659 RepID=UPI00262BC858|nr:hypothetical protein [uncultured Algibacter sp.]
MKSIHCMVFGHEYKVTRQVTYHVQEYTCKNCKKELTTNSNGNLIELTPKFKEINDVLERIHHKRLVRMNKRKKLRQTQEKAKLMTA